MKRPQAVLRARRGWSTKLARPITLRDGTKLITLADARTMMIERITGARENGREWQAAARNLLEAAEHGSSEAIEDATKQMELALFLNALLSLE